MMVVAVMPERPTVEDRIRAALWFAAREFGIFTVWSTDPDGTCRCPLERTCPTPGKHPVTANGFKDATRDPDRIRRLLSAGSEPNYGLVCPDGVFAWDADAPGWQDQMADMEAKYGPLPPTLRTVTAHGEHIFFRWPDDLPRPLGEMFGMVTRWGSGRGAGYVIGPRSVHPSGHVYAPAPESAFEVAVLPAAWANAALMPSGGRTGAQAADGGVDITIEEGAYHLPDRVASGARYDAIRDYTAHLYNRRLSTDEMWAQVVMVLAPRFETPLSDLELRQRFDRCVSDMAGRLGEPRGIDTAPSARQRRQDGEDPGWTINLDDEAFPADPDAEAFGGTLGAVLDVISDGTDASRVGMLGSLIALAGALIPRQTFWNREVTTSPYICLVGPSAIGRKGTAMNRARIALGLALGRSVVNRLLLSGLASGEGLVSALARQRPDGTPDAQVVALIWEEEFARMLATRQREGATLDQYMRQAFDMDVLAQHKSASNKVVEAPYWLPALVAITPTELRDRIEGGAIKSGSGNRWLYLPVMRRDVATDGGTPVLPPDLTTALLGARHSAEAHWATPLPLDAAVTSRLTEYSDWIGANSIGQEADLSPRLATMALRIALVHAAVDQAGSVGTVHLDRALALTQYARRGIPWVFGPIVGNPDAQLLLRRLRMQPDGLTANWVTQHAIRDPLRREAAKDELVRLGLAQVVVRQTGGRPLTVLVAVAPRAEARARARVAPPPDDPTFRAPRAPARPPTPDDATPVHDMHESPSSRSDQPARKVHDSRTDSAERVHVDDVDGIGRRTDGTIWCHYFRPHQTAHRDVTTDPWCEVCSDREGTAE
jgi:hypothetical protein